MVGYESSTVTRLQNTFRHNVSKGGSLHDPSLDLETVLDLVKRHGQLDSVRELAKSNATAAKLRNAANRLYLEGKLEDALVGYNESICYAEPGTDQLGMGYANRSAVYFEQDEYEFALYNIHLAKEHNYPERLWPKLQARKDKCKQQIAKGNSRKTVPCPRMDINVDTNPRIPFLADGIKMNYDPKFGRGLVAERDFQPGDIILNEKLEMCAIDSGLFYRNCGQCGAQLNFSLIPCPTCTFSMYCNQECLELNWQLYHRFECGVATKLCSVSRSAIGIFTRFFFYGLTQFEDDLQAMMDYCERDVTTASNPLELDFTNPNRLEIFKAVHNSVPRLEISIEHVMNPTVATNYVALLKNPSISRIIRKVAHRRFFLKSVLMYFRLTFAQMTFASYEQDPAVCVVRPIGSLISHSCDPNVITNLESNSAKVFVLRPIRKGEQIFTFYEQTWWLDGPGEMCHFKCQCIVCDQGQRGQNWHKLRQRPLPQKARDDLIALQQFVNHPNKATRLNETQQFIKRYAHLHPQAPEWGYVLRSYYCNLCQADREGNVALSRAELQAAFVEH